MYGRRKSERNYWHKSSLGQQRVALYINSAVLISYVVHPEQSPTAAMSTPEQHSILRGGCYCGSVSFSVNSVPVVSAYCHCTICQRLFCKRFLPFRIQQLFILLQQARLYIHCTSPHQPFLGHTLSPMNYVSTHTSPLKSLTRYVGAARIVDPIYHRTIRRQTDGVSGLAC